MSVIDIIESWEERTAGRNTTELTALRLFTVKFDTADNPVNRPLLALSATTRTLSIPLVGDGHPYNQWLYVAEKTVKAASQFLYEVTVRYSAALKANQTHPIAPWDEKPKIKWGSMATNEKIDRDINDKPIVNSAGEIPDPPVTEDFYETTLTITKNVKTFDPVKIAEYRNKLNLTVFYGFDAGKVLCTDITTEEAYYGKTKYYIKTCEFRIRTNDWKQGWNRRFLDEGFRVAKGKNNKLTGTIESTRIVDNESNPISEPALLDGKGGLLTTDKGVFLEFETKKEIAFSGLGV